MNEQTHIPVLLNEVIGNLKLFSGATVLDGTLGGGGYAHAIAYAIGKSGTIIGLDLDSSALARAEAKINDVCKHHLLKANFRNIKFVLETLNIKSLDAVVLDLGLSSFELEESGRGFSFQLDEPLVMTFDDNPDEHAITAEIVVNDWSESTLELIFRGFGGERHSRKIAAAIVNARSSKRITTTKELVSIVESVLPRRGKLNPATKVFQAIRMAVNDELGALTDAINASVEVLNPGGRLAVVTFHEGEDRVVKHMFRDYVANNMGKLINKKPIVPTTGELKTNPRSRSAKLRIFEKTN